MFQDIQDDLVKNKAISDHLEDLCVTGVNDLLKEGVEQEQLLQEITEINIRLKKVYTWCENCCDEIEVMVPLSEKLESYLIPLKVLHKEVENEIKVKHCTGADLDLIKAEVEKFEVGYFLLLFIYGFF